MGFISVVLEHGGVGAYLILLSALFLMVIGSERIITLFFKLSQNTDVFIEKIRQLILSKQYTDALQICNSQENLPNLSVIKSALLALENGREAMRSSLGAAVLEVNHRCEKRLQYLALIANVATLLGLLGTILGLIRTFAAIADKDVAEKARLLGLGISEAMYSTASGLGVGIAAMVIHTLCTTKSDAIVGQAQDVGFKVITWIEQSERKA